MEDIEEFYPPLEYQIIILIIYIPILILYFTIIMLIFVLIIFNLNLILLMISSFFLIYNIIYVSPILENPIYEFIFSIIISLIFIINRKL